MPNVTVTFAGVAGAATAAGTVVYSDTVIEILHGTNKVKIVMTDESSPVDLNYPPHGISETLKDFPD